MMSFRLPGLVRCAVGCLLIGVTGCGSPRRPASGTETAQSSGKEPAKIESRLETTQTYLIDGRFVIIPVTPKAPGKRGSFSGGYTDSFAWFGLSYSKIFGADQFVDLVVVDTEKRETFHVFSHPAVLGEWQCSLRREDGQPVGELNYVRSGSRNGYKLRFANTLLLPARVDDADGDGRITSKDPSRLYRFDLMTRELKPITPETHELANVHIEGDVVTVVLEKADEENTAAVYRYDMKTGEGAMAADGLHAQDGE